MTPRARGLAKGTGPTTNLDGPLLDSDAVAKVLGITRRHVQRLVSERRIPYIKVGRFVRFDPGELNVWLDAQPVVPQHPTPRQFASWR
jgi:excisionase family DNA binding protein